MESQLISVNGNLSAHLHDPDGITPRNIFERGDRPGVHATIRLNGPGTNLMANGHFHVTCAWERIGSGAGLAESQTTGTSSITMNGPNSALSDAYVTLPNNLPVGVYKLAVYAQIHVSTPGPDFRGIAGFVDVGMFEVYDA
jgi:hypothetical protein